MYLTSEKKDILSAPTVIGGHDIWYSLLALDLHSNRLQLLRNEDARQDKKEMKKDNTSSHILEVGKITAKALIHCLNKVASYSSYKLAEFFL